MSPVWVKKYLLRLLVLNLILSIICGHIQFLFLADLFLVCFHYSKKKKKSKNIEKFLKYKNILFCVLFNTIMHCFCIVFIQHNVCVCVFFVFLCIYIFCIAHHLVCNYGWPMKLCIHDCVTYLSLISFVFTLYQFVLLYTLLCDLFIDFKQTTLIFMLRILIVRTRKFKEKGINNHLTIITH